MSLTERLTSDLKQAMRAKEKNKLTLLRSVKALFKNIELENKEPLNEAQEVKAVLKMIKQRREAAAGFRKGGAEERALNEDWEAAELESYLPAAPTEEEIAAAIDEEVAKIPADERSPKSMGILMKALNAKFEGQPIDGKALSQKVREKLLG